MRYLRESDYKAKITEYDLQTLLEDEAHPDAILFDSEIRAQEQMALFFRKRYDLTALFKTYPVFVNGRPYDTGDTVWYGTQFQEFIYTPLSGTSSLPSSGLWSMIEPRYVTIVDWMVTISMYKLHERISPDNIPTHRKDAYDEVMRLLKMVQEEKLSPDFPEVEDRNFNIYISGKEDTGIGFYY